MDSSAPKVTVVVPAFNEPPHVLEQSLDSVATQTFRDFECLVIDESTQPESRDACIAMCARDPRFRRIQPPKRIGLAASLNLGITQARGELIARFDSDDLCLPNRLEQQVAFMDGHPEVGVLGGGLEIMDEAGHTLAFRSYPTNHEAIERRLHFTTPVAHPTAMLRRHAVLQLGGYNTSFRFAEDLDLWLRMINQGVRFANLPEVLVRYRQQHTRRNPLHWRFNLRARTHNLRWRQLPLRMLGLCAIGLWTAVPDGLQERVFHGMLLRRQWSLHRQLDR